MRRDEVIIWVLPQRRGYRIGTSNGSIAPLPFGAEAIVCVDSADKFLMLRWIKKRLKRGWPLEKIRQYCG